MKKLRLAILGVLVVAVIATYFLVNTTKPAPSIVVLGEDSSNLAAYRSLAEEFEKATGTQVSFDGATFEQAMLKADNDFRAGTRRYDIVLQYNFSLAPYVRNNYVASIKDVFSPRVLAANGVSASFFPEAISETCFYYSDYHDLSSPPEQFGFPFAANTMLLVYNNQLFSDPALRKEYRRLNNRDLTPPTTWAEYLNVAEFFTSARQDLKGVCMQGAAGGWLYYELSNYLVSMGTGTSAKKRGWEEDRPVTIATPRNEQVLNYYRRLQRSSSGDYFTVDAARQRDIMMQGHTAMAIMWSDYLQPLAQADANGKPLFGFAPIPGNKSGLAGGAFYINRRSRNMKAAADFVLFALQGDNQAKLIERGLCSPVRSAYTEKVLARVRYARALRDSLERGVFMFEAGTNAELFNNALTEQVQRFMRGDLTAAAALQRAQAEIVGARQVAR